MHVHELRAKQTYRPTPRTAFRMKPPQRWEETLERAIAKFERIQGNIFHVNPHGDELNSLVQLALTHNNRYPGVANAPDKYRADPNLIDAYAELEDNGYLCTGTGGGPLDDHNDEYKEQNLCCTDLVNDLLGINDRVSLYMADWTRYADRFANVLPFELPTLIKEWHVTHQNYRFVMQLARWLYADLRLYEQGRRAKQPVNFSMASLARQLEDEFRPHIGKSGLNRLLVYLRQADEIGDYQVGLSEEENDKRARPLEIARIFRCIMQLYTKSRHKDDTEHIRSRFMSILRDSAREGIAFTDELKAFKRFKFTPFTIEGSEKLNALYVKSDSHRIVKIARKRGADIVVKENSKGQVQILTRNRTIDDRYRPYLTVKYLAEEYRKRELLARGMSLPPLTREQWQAPGTLKECPWWYYMPEGEGLFNSTDQSSTGVEATRLRGWNDAFKGMFPLLALAPADAVGDEDPDRDDNTDSLPDTEDADRTTFDLGANLAYEPAAEEAVENKDGEKESEQLVDEDTEEEEEDEDDEDDDDEEDHA